MCSLHASLLCSLVLLHWVPNLLLSIQRHAGSNVGYMLNSEQHLSLCDYLYFVAQLGE